MSSRLRRIVYLAEMLRKGFRRDVSEICRRLEIAPRTLFQDIRFIREELEIDVKYDRANRYYYSNTKDVKEIDVIEKLAFRIEDQEMRVVVRFSPTVSAQIQESQWHPNQKIRISTDGYCILILPTVNLSEIKRLVLTYGSAAEILQPDSLRQEMQMELQMTLVKYWLKKSANTL